MVYLNRTLGKKGYGHELERLSSFTLTHKLK